MKRARRQTVARGLTGRQRRRNARMLRWAFRYGDVVGGSFRAPWELRAVRRMTEAGLCAAACSKYRPWAGGIVEVTVSRSRESLRARYPGCVLPGKRRQ